MAEVEEQPMDVDDKNRGDKVKHATADVESLTFEDIREQCRCIERAETTKEVRMINRALRSLITVRRRLNPLILSRLINHYFVGQNLARQKNELLSNFKILPPTETTTETVVMPKSPRQQRKAGAGASANVGLLPEVETYLHLLVVLYLMNEKRYDEAEKCSLNMLARLQNQNKRSLDPLVAHFYYFYAVIAEKLNKLDDLTYFFQIRLRIATLRHDEDCQATLINCLLRAYLLQNNYELASALIPKVNFPLSGSTNQWARYHYYVGRIKAKELQYAEAKQSLQLALRKAPHHTAIGFKQSAQKLLVTVELLMGQIPDRSLFREGIYRKSLAPYLQLAQAVRVGDVERFDSTLKKFSVQFDNDGTNDLVVRLRQNVIKTAVRQICLAYSHISLADVQKKLRLTQTQDAEYILAKAIKDGVIDAELDKENQFLKSRESGNIYNTPLPQMEFHKRIQFCLDIHTQAVKAMRFPPKSYAKDIETADEKREREQQELEFAKEMAEDDDFT